MPPRSKLIEGIGEVEMIRDPRSKHVSIKVVPYNSINIKVSVPKGVPFERAENFVLEKSNWIKKKLAVIQQVEQQKTQFDENTIFKTRYRTLKIKRSDGMDLTGQITRYEIIITCPLHIDMKHEKVQCFICDTLEKASRNEAKYYLPLRVEQLSKKHGFTYKRVAVKKMKTRWGSCSGVNNINLNMDLILLPQELTDYVILHELVHTVEKNHGKQFWALLDKLTGNAKALNQKLKQHRPNVY